MQIFAAEPDVLARGAAAVRAGPDDRREHGLPGQEGLRHRRRRRPRPRPRAASRGRPRDPRCGVGPVTIKIRAVWDDAEVNCVEVARAAARPERRPSLHAARGADVLGPGALEARAHVKAAVSIPVLGSGDVWTADDALRMRARRQRATRCSSPAAPAETRGSSASCARRARLAAASGAYPRRVGRRCSTTCGCRWSTVGGSDRRRTRGRRSCSRSAS